MSAARDRIIKLLNNYNIEYSAGGNNVSANRCVGVCCPFCGDSGFHGGIFLDGVNNFTCWKCKTNVSLYSFVKEVSGTSYDEFTKVTRSLRFSKANDVVHVKPDTSSFIAKAIEFPRHYVPIINNDVPSLVSSFLKRRNYTIDDCVKYGAGYCKYGRYSHRFIIPVYDNGILVAFQGRDMTGKSPIKYLSSPVTTGNPLNNFLYGYDGIKDKAILVEGVFDKWRTGELAICSFGASLTAFQVRLILKLNLSELIFAWERDKYVVAKKAARQFKPFIDKIKILLLPVKSDPDTLGSVYMNEKIESTEYI